MRTYGDGSGDVKLSQEESRALAFIAAMILLSILGRWADRPQPLRSDLARVDLDSLEAASSALTRPPPAKKGASADKKVSKQASNATAGGPPQLIDLNTATAAQLETLPGVGPVLARRIIAYRDSAGRFANTDALLAVKGVGPAMLKRVQPLVRAP